MELIDIIPEFNLYEEYWKIYTKSDIIPPQYVAADAVIERSIIGEGTEVHGDDYQFGHRSRRYHRARAQWYAIPLSCSELSYRSRRSR